MPVITLLTDFGLRDGYVGVMKGVIWKICPEAQVADITHFIPPQNIRQGAVALLRTVKYFPLGTVHIAVVDPGVGTNRKPLAAEVDGHFYVGPDNGLFSLVFQEAAARGLTCRFYSLDKPEFWLPEISRVFHGRDIFAPAGAHIANGVPLEKMGTLMNNPIRFTNTEPRQQGDGWAGEVVSIDNFGNIATSIGTKQLQGNSHILVKIAGETINGLISTFEDRPAGELAAMIGTDNDLIVAVVRGSAVERLHVKPGDPVEVQPITGTAK
jgi:S-adenosyl-L-methionine hydrolase (adenosine-forming)